MGPGSRAQALADAFPAVTWDIVPLHGDASANRGADGAWDDAKGALLCAGAVPPAVATAAARVAEAGATGPRAGDGSFDGLCVALAHTP